MHRRSLFKHMVAVPLALRLASLTASASAFAQAAPTTTSLSGLHLFPADNDWNQDISAAPVDPNSAALIASIGLDRGLHPDFGTVYNGAPNGIPYVVVDSSQPQVPVFFEYARRERSGAVSDPGRCASRGRRRFDWRSPRPGARSRRGVAV